jgi:hypothetical protein
MKSYGCSAIRGNEVIIALVTPIVKIRNVCVTNEIRAAERCGFLRGINKEAMNSHGTNEIPVYLLKFLTELHFLSPPPPLRTPYIRACLIPFFAMLWS